MGSCRPADRIRISVRRRRSQCAERIIFVWSCNHFLVIYLEAGLNLTYIPETCFLGR